VLTIEQNALSDTKHLGKIANMPRSLTSNIIAPSNSNRKGGGGQYYFETSHIFGRMNAQLNSTGQLQQ
jgi:hypothetical protein